MLAGDALLIKSKPTCCLREKTKGFSFDYLIPSEGVLRDGFYIKSIEAKIISITIKISMIKRIELPNLQFESAVTYALE